MTGLLYLSMVTMTKCGCVAGSFISQLESIVRVQPGLSTSFECHVMLEGLFSIFWIKVPLDKAPVCVAISKGTKDVVVMCKQFEHQSRINVTWNERTWTLKISSVEPVDVGTYVCGIHSFGHIFFGNGTKLILDEQTDVVSTKSPITEKDKDKDGKIIILEYLVPTLAVTNVASIFLTICLCHFIKKKRSHVTLEASPTGEKKTDEVNYAALTFSNKQRRTVQETKVDSTVVYGPVRHQEEL